MGHQTTVGFRERRYSIISVVIFSENLEIRPALLCTDMESLVDFSLTPKHVTLDDLQWQFYVNFFLRQYVERG